MAEDVPRPRILLIEDDPSVRLLIERVLARRYDVQSVSTKAEARAVLARDSAFVLLLCDEFLGDGRGSDLHAALTDDADPAARRMLFMSGDASADYLRGPGGGHVLYKPFDLRQLQDVVAARIEQLGPASARSGAGRGAIGAGRRRGGD